MEVNGSTSAGSTEAQVTESTESFETTAENQETTESQVEVGTEEKKPAPMKKKFKLKVDGEEFEEEIDLADEERIRKELQLSRAAKKRMAEANEAKRKAYEIVQAFEKDPETMLKRMGPKGREIAEKFLLGVIQEDMMSPEEKERQSKDARLKAYEEQEERAKTEAQEKVLQEKERAYAQQFQKLIIDALEKTKLPKSPALVKQMAGLIQKNMQYGLDLTPEDLASEIMTDKQQLIRSIFSEADGDQILQLLGDEVANKIRKSDLKKLREKQLGGYQPHTQSQAQVQAKPQESRRMTLSEWREKLDREFGS